MWVCIYHLPYSLFWLICQSLEQNLQRPGTFLNKNRKFFFFFLNLYIWLEIYLNAFETTFVKVSTKFVTCAHTYTHMCTQTSNLRLSVKAPSPRIKAPDRNQKNAYKNVFLESPLQYVPSYSPSLSRSLYKIFQGLLEIRRFWNKRSLC